LLGASNIWQAIAKLNFILDPFVGCIVRIIMISNAPLIYSKALTRLQHTIYLLIAANLCSKNTNLTLPLQKIKTDNKYWYSGILKKKALKSYRIRCMTGRLNGIDSIKGVVIKWHLHEVSLHYKQIEV
jgi:hypothetical protein